MNEFNKEEALKKKGEIKFKLHNKIHLMTEDDILARSNSEYVQEASS